MEVWGPDGTLINTDITLVLKRWKNDFQGVFTSDDKSNAAFCQDVSCLSSKSQG